MHSCGPAYALSRYAMEQIVVGGGAQNHRLLSNEDTTMGLWMLAHNVQFFDDRRLCANECSRDSAFVAVHGQDIWGCATITENPQIQMSRILREPACRTRAPDQLPFARSLFGRFNAMIDRYLQDLEHGNQNSTNGRRVYY